MKRIMIDLETLGNGVNACVVQIGACDFDGENQFKRNIDPADAQRNGAEIDGGTVMWWLQQEQAARDSICAKFVPAVSERQAFHELNDYLADADEIWSHATFDFVIVMNCLRRLVIKPKFSYRAARDIRTLNALAGKQHHHDQVVRTDVAHDALADAIYQVGYCKMAIEKVMGAQS